LIGKTFLMEMAEIKQQSFVTQNSHKEYRLVVRPDMAVQEKIMAEKQSLRDGYRIEAAAEIKPYITVIDFLAREEMEETLIRWIQRICSRHKSFLVTLNNYSGFPAHSIYLRVLDPVPFYQLALQLKVIDDFISTPAVTNHKPHLNISGKLQEQVYEKAMFDYAQKTFHESFAANELILVRKERQSDDCKILNVFHFLPATQHCGEVA
jgi:hypothetical protein